MNIKFTAHTRFKLNEVKNLPTSDVNLDCVVNLDEGVWIPNSSSVISNHIWYSLHSNTQPPHLAKLVLQENKSETLMTDVGK